VLGWVLNLELIFEVDIMLLEDLVLEASLEVDVVFASLDEVTFELDLLDMILETFVEVPIFALDTLVFTKTCEVKLCFKIVLALVLENVTSVAVKS